MAEREYAEGQLVATWIGIGPGLGVAFGAAVGAGQENRARAAGRLRPLARPSGGASAAPSGSGLASCFSAL